MILDEKYKIESEELNVTLYEKVKKKNGNYDWQPVSYHLNFEQTYKYIINREINLTNMKDLETVLEKIQELNDYLKEQFK